ncbi:hypothetical protein D3C83_172650 [compost metagenome]
MPSVSTGSLPSGMGRPCWGTPLRSTTVSDCTWPRMANTLRKGNSQASALISKCWISLVTASTEGSGMIRPGNWKSSVLTW